MWPFNPVWIAGRDRLRSREAEEIRSRRGGRQGTVQPGIRARPPVQWRRGWRGWKPLPRGRGRFRLRVPLCHRAEYVFDCIPVHFCLYWIPKTFFVAVLVEWSLSGIITVYYDPVCLIMSHCLSPNDGPIICHLCDREPWDLCGFHGEMPMLLLWDLGVEVKSSSLSWFLSMNINFGSWHLGLGHKYTLVPCSVLASWVFVTPVLFNSVLLGSQLPTRISSCGPFPCSLAGVDTSIDMTQWMLLLGEPTMTSWFGRWACCIVKALIHIYFLIIFRLTYRPDAYVRYNRGNHTHFVLNWSD